MSITIYNGKINVTASDDGLNAAGGDSNNDIDIPGSNPPHFLSSKNIKKSNLGSGPNTGSGPSSGPNPSPGPNQPGGGGNSSYYISI